MDVPDATFLTPSRVDSPHFVSPPVHPRQSTRRSMVSSQFLTPARTMATEMSRRLSLTPGFGFSTQPLDPPSPEARCCSQCVKWAAVALGVGLIAVALVFALGAIASATQAFNYPTFILSFSNSALSTVGGKIALTAAIIGTFIVGSALIYCNWPLSLHRQ